MVLYPASTKLFDFLHNVPAAHPAPSGIGNLVSFPGDKAAVK